MKGPFKVYLNETPLTVDITDEKRAALAYNMLYAVGEENTLINNEDYDETDLRVHSADGEVFEPKLDAEWYGSEKESSAYYNAMLDKLMNEAAENGEAIDRDGAEERLSIYTVHPEGLDIDNELDDFAPVTYDRDKAVEMVNFLRYGLDPGITLTTRHADMEYRDYDFIEVNADSIHISDEEGNFVDIAPDPEWARGQMNPDVIMITEKETEAGKAMEEPVSWKTAFADKVRTAYEEGALTRDNMREWYKSDGAAFGSEAERIVTEILDYKDYQDQQEAQSFADAVGGISMDDPSMQQ